MSDLKITVQAYFLGYGVPGNLAEIAAREK